MYFTFSDNVPYLLEIIRLQYGDHYYDGVLKFNHPTTHYSR